MATRTVRLDREAETVLKEVQDATGLPMSEAFKRGLRILQEQVRHKAVRRPYDTYRQLDLGPGGYARVPSTDAKRGVREAVRKKLHR